MVIIYCNLQSLFFDARTMAPCPNYLLEKGRFKFLSCSSSEFHPVWGNSFCDIELYMLRRSDIHCQTSLTPGKSSLSLTAVRCALCLTNSVVWSLVQFIPIAANEISSTSHYPGGGGHISIEGLKTENKFTGAGIGGKI